MEEVLSTIFAGCRVAIASSHLFMTFIISFYLFVFRLHVPPGVLLHGRRGLPHEPIK